MKTFKTLEELKRAARQFRQYQSWTFSSFDFHDRKGKPIACELRWDPPPEINEKKDFLQSSEDPISSLWSLKGLDAHNPLYRQPTILEAKGVIIVEGAKCADMLAELHEGQKDFAITTLIGGAESEPKNTDFSPVVDLVKKGFPIIISPDNDDPGTRYSTRITKHLLELGIDPKQIRTIDPTQYGFARSTGKKHPDNKKDVVNWIQDQRAKKISEVELQNSFKAILHNALPINPDDYATKQEVRKAPKQVDNQPDGRKENRINPEAI